MEFESDVEKRAFELINAFMKDGNSDVDDRLSISHREQIVPEVLEARLYRMSKQNIKLLSSKMTSYLKNHTFEVKGTSGQTYVVTVGTQLKCSCRDHMTRFTHCKHILYVLLRELKIIDLRSPIYYTLAPSENELKDIFSRYHPIM